jgi:hypothetical protein
MHVFNVRLCQIDPPIEILIAQFSSDQSIESLLEQVYNGFPELRLRASVIVVRPQVTDVFSAADLETARAGKPRPQSPFLEALSAAVIEHQQFERFRGLPIMVLHGSHCVPTLSENINPLAESGELVDDHLTLASTLDDIRSAELRFIVDCSRALLRSVEGSYYEPPSHKPARSFLRVGNIQYSRQAIDAVTFWLLPHLRDAGAILVDTWSLSSIALNVSRTLAAIRQEKPVPVEMLTHYQDATVERQAALTEVLDRLVAEAGPARDHPLKVTCIVSATHSGSLVKVLQDQVELSSLWIDLNFVAVFRLGETCALPALCDLSEEADFAPLTDAEISDRAAVRIDPQIYFPLTYKEVLHLPLQTAAEPLKPLLELVRGHGIISVHRDESSDGPTRHHAIHIDTEKFVALPDVEARLKAAVSQLDPLPTLILTPRHSAARQMARIAAATVKDLTGRLPVHVEHPSLQFEPETGREEANKAVRTAISTVAEQSSLLILDDSFITGARLAGYQTRLRRMGVGARLHYLVAIGQPDNLAAWADFRKKLSFRNRDARTHHEANTVTALYEVCLPNWQNSRCPWCREQVFYENLSLGGAGLPAAVDARLESLRDRDSGLRGNLFAGEAGSSPMQLSEGSIFATSEMDQAEIFTAIAAAIHRLRVEPASGKAALGHRRFPIATVLDDEHYLEKTFTESIIRASFLRAASCEELVHTDPDAEATRTQRIQRIMTSRDPNEHDLAVELVIAQAAQKCAILDAVSPSALPPLAGTLLSLLLGESPAGPSTDSSGDAF